VGHPCVTSTIPKLMTRDQRSALRNQGAFAIKKLKKLQRLCATGSSRTDLWLAINFAVYDLNLAKARRDHLNARKKKRKPPLCY
jgi:hypothetical protein